MSDFAVFSPVQLAAHDGVVEANLRLYLAEQIEGVAKGDDLLGNLLRMDTTMAEGARMALDIAAEIVRDDPRGTITE